SVRPGDVAVRHGGAVLAAAGHRIRSVRVTEKAEGRRQKAEVRKFPSGYFCLLLSAFCLFLACARESRFLERSITLSDHQYRYRVWLPPHYTKVHHWPVILFLHGSNERGDDN